MSSNNSHRRNVYDLDAVGLRLLRLIYPARSEPSVTSHLPPPPRDVTERINALQFELAACTRELGDVRPNYDRTFVEAAQAAREIDELQAKLSMQR